MVPVGVRQDDVADRRVGDLAQRLHRSAGALFGSAGIDRHHAGGVDQECDVREIESLRNVDSVPLAHEPRIREPEALIRSDREVPRHGGRFEGVDPRPAQHLLGSGLVAERPVGQRQAPVDSAVQVRGELVAVLERGLEVGGGLLRLAGSIRQLGEDEAAQQAAGDGIRLRPAVELADPFFDPGHAPQQGDFSGSPDLEQAFQREQQRALWLLPREPLEVFVPVPLVTRRDEFLRGDERHQGLRLGPGSGLREGFHLPVLCQRRRRSRNAGAPGAEEQGAG